MVACLSLPGEIEDHQDKDKQKNAITGWASLIVSLFLSFIGKSFSGRKAGNITPLSPKRELYVGCVCVVVGGT